MKPLVSVIITTYNRCAMVGDAIESVLKQDFLDYEIIVVDDGSTDDTEDALRKYSQINYFYQENQGISRARNQGLALSQGEFVCFLDSDDFWLPKKLSVQVKVMQDHPGLKLNYLTFTLILYTTRICKVV